MSGWGDVTLREFDALTVLENGAENLLNAYWDELHASPANVFRGDEPTRLSDGGRVWLADLVDRVRVLATTTRAAGADVTPWRQVAQELLAGVGFLTVCNAAKIARGERIA